MTACQSPSQSDKPDAFSSRPLGRPIVTIDDLQVLLDLLKVHEGGLLPPVVYGSDGSAFSDPDELRRCPAPESVTVKIITPRGVKVELGPKVARIWGASDTCSAIRNKWAKPRQGGRIRAAIGFPPLIIEITSFVMFMCCFIGSELAKRLDPQPASFVDLSSMQLPSTILMAMGIILMVILLLPMRHATIIPYTREEYRERRRERRRHIRTIVISVVSAATALLALTLTILGRFGLW